MSEARPTGRGVVVLVGAALAYLAGWAFGTRELAALALVLALSIPLALVVAARAARAPLRLTRRLPPHATAGSALHASVLVEPVPRLAVATVVERCPGLGDPCARLTRRGATLVGGWSVDLPARGRYELAGELVLEDPLGLARCRARPGHPGLVRVEPQLVDLGAPRALVGARRDGARRAFANAGDGLAGVRDHAVGEPLRRVHWRTTARRGRLTVRELEEHPHGDLLVLLDASRPADGLARSPVFECAVRAAGSLAVHAARGGIPVAFASTDRRGGRVDVAVGASNAALLDALCAVEADGETPLAAALARTGGASLCVVTADLSAAVVEQLLRHRARRRPVALVALDAGSWHGDPFAFAGAVGTLVRGGVEAVVVARDDDLASCLASLAGRAVARAV